MVLGFRPAKNIGIYGVFLLRELQKHTKTPPIWRFSVTTGLRKKLQGQQQQQQQQPQQQQQQQQQQQLQQ